MSIVQILGDIYITTARVFAWTSLAWLGGSVIGYAAYKSKLFFRILLPIINLFRHISPFCWLPLVILLTGLGELSVGLVLLSAMVFHAMLLCVEILQNLPRQNLEQADLDGASGINKLLYIELPLSMGELINLYRILWSVAWATVIAAEMLGVKSGMGYRLLDYRYLLQYKEMLLYIGIIGLIGVATDYLLLHLRQRFRIV